VLGMVSLAGAAEPQGQVIGFYSHGRLEVANSLPSEGKGFIHLFPARNHFFGSQGMIDLLERTAGAFAADFDGERLQIADISAERGGPVGQHVSHQNGLDADIVYFRNNQHEQTPTEADDFIELFVLSGMISPNFDHERNYQFIRRLVTSGRVNRIFMDPVIKGTLCKYSEGRDDEEDGYATRTETLRRMRPYPNHANHMHVRLTCPAASPRCIAQDEVPPGDGCNALGIMDAGPAD
ncbi:MAG: penicillin-insensitive murein endopeptidase, partial [Bdellovibrionota bacterium]